ncbi:MAG: hypothetical protein V4642_15285 [Bacteroidota bacterium]
MFNRNKILIFSIILLSGLLSSCATILNRESHDVKITFSENIKNIDVGDVHQTEKQQIYQIRRSADALVLKATWDTNVTVVEIQPKSSMAYWLNIPFGTGIGLILEKNNPKRWEYPRQIHLELKDDNTIEILRYKPFTQGTLNGNISFAILNHYYLQAFESKQKEGGALGLGLGLEYYYQDKSYVSAGFGATLDAGLGESFGGPRERTNALFVNALNNHVLGYYEVGYGLHFSRLQWNRDYIGEVMPGDDATERFVNTFGVGPSFSLQLRRNDYGRFGIIYQPNVLNLNGNPKFDYQHLISFTASFNTNFKL